MCVCVAIVTVVCGKICGKMCGKIKKLSDWNKNWCGSRYGPHDYDSDDKKTIRQKEKKKKKKKTGGRRALTPFAGARTRGP